MFELFVVLAVVGAVGLFVWLVWWVNWRIYWRFPTFEKYKLLHPNLVKNGQCSCHNCGGRRLYLKHIDLDRHRHICVVCGTVLYRS